MSTPAPNQTSGAATPPRRRSSTGAASTHSNASSRSSSASQRARVPYGAKGYWNWGKAQPHKQRLPILQATLRPSRFKHAAHDELAIVTAVKDFRISDFGHGGEPFKSELYELERTLKAAKLSGHSAPSSVAQNFLKKYSKVKFNEYFAALVESKKSGPTERVLEDIPKPHINNNQTLRRSPSIAISGVTGLNARSSSSSSRRSSSTSISDASSNTSTESSRAKLPSGPTGSWYWGLKQPKKRVPVLDIVLIKKTGNHSYGSELVLKTAKKDFRISEFGFFDAPFKSDLYTLERILEKAQAYGTSSPLNIVELFIKQYLKIKYNTAYATLVKNTDFNLHHTMIFLEAQFCRRKPDLLHELYSGCASVTEGPANIPPNERRIVKVDLLPLNASGYDSTSIQITTYDGKNELLEHPQASFEDQQDAKTLNELLREMKHAATYRDAGGILRETARDFALEYPRIDIVSRRLVRKSQA